MIYRLDQAELNYFFVDNFFQWNFMTLYQVFEIVEKCISYIEIVLVFSPIFGFCIWFLMPSMIWKAYQSI